MRASGGRGLDREKEAALSHGEREQCDLGRCRVADVLPRHADHGARIGTDLSQSDQEDEPDARREAASASPLRASRRTTRSRAGARPTTRTGSSSIRASADRRRRRPRRPVTAAAANAQNESIPHRSHKACVIGTSTTTPTYTDRNQVGIKAICEPTRIISGRTPRCVRDRRRSRPRRRAAGGPATRAGAGGTPAKPSTTGRRGAPPAT